MTTLSLRSRVVGCLLGGAIGDALGAPVEFLSSRQIRDRFGSAGVTGFVDAYGRIGAITDDTQMTLFTAEGLLRTEARSPSQGLVDAPSVVHRSYLRWLSTQGVSVPAGEWGDLHNGWLITNEFLHHRRAPGNTCVSALRSGKQGTAEQPLNDSKGCGGVMRVAPVGLVAHNPFGLAVEISALTHGHPSGFIASGAFALMISKIVGGGTLTESVAAAVSEARMYPGHEETVSALEQAASMAGRGSGTGGMVEGLGAGWVAEEALAMSVFCALGAADFLSGVLMAVNHGGDSDSTGAITGNLLGALLGVEAIPLDLLDDLEGREAIEQLAEDLVAVFGDHQEPDTVRYPPG